MRRSPLPFDTRSCCRPTTCLHRFVRSGPLSASHSRGPDVQHLAYEDLCFVAEKDGERRDAVFNDEKGLSWSAFLAAALKPVDAALSAAKTLAATGGGQQDVASAARELWCVLGARHGCGVHSLTNTCAW